MHCQCIFTNVKTIALSVYKYSNYMFDIESQNAFMNWYVEFFKNLMEPCISS